MLVVRGAASRTARGSELSPQRLERCSFRARAKHQGSSHCGDTRARATEKETLMPRAQKTNVDAASSQSSLVGAPQEAGIASPRATTAAAASCARALSSMSGTGRSRPLTSANNWQRVSMSRCRSSGSSSSSGRKITLVLPIRRSLPSGSGTSKKRCSSSLTASSLTSPAGVAGVVDELVSSARIAALRPSDTFPSVRQSSTSSCSSCHAWLRPCSASASRSGAVSA